MRRFEYIGGTSEKFWEVERDGTTVTVVFGRIGTAGQTQVKDLGTADAAEGQLAKLVAEKVKKGYVETGGTSPAPPPAATSPPPRAKQPSPTPAPAPPAAAAAADEPVVTPAGTAPEEADLDEDAWTVPPVWWRQSEPFRGRGPKRSTKVDSSSSDVVEKLVADVERSLASVLDDPDSDRRLVEQARLHLGVPGRFLRPSKQAPSPLGAAVVAAVVVGATHHGRRGELPRFADHWVTTSGIPFAAEAGALLAGVRVEVPSSRRGSNPVALWAAPDDYETWDYEPILARLRALLAMADDRDHTEVTARLEGHRRGSTTTRLATSHLVPSEQGWVEEDISLIHRSGHSATGFAALLSSVTTERQARTLLDSVAWGALRNPARAYSLAAHVGPDVAPLLARLFDETRDPDDKKRILGILAHLPTDTAFELLLDRVDQRNQPTLFEVMARFPRRAMRLLAVASSGPGANTTAADRLLRRHALSHPDLVERTRSQLGGAALANLDAAAAVAASIPVAPANRLADLLVSPPWAVRRERPRQIVVEGFGPPSPTRLAWRPGEQEVWAQTETSYRPASTSTDAWADLVDRAVRGHGWAQLEVLAAAPVEMVRPRLGQVRAIDDWNVGPPVLRRLLGRFGDDAIELVDRAVHMRPGSLAEALLPVEGTQMAVQMTEWYVGSKSVRPVALRWIERNAGAAARDLLPVALGKPGKARTMAEAVLRALDQRGHGEAIRAAAAERGSEAMEAIDVALAIDPLHLLPARMPALPAWLDPAHLPQVLLRDRSAALPIGAVGHLCTMLAISKPGDTYAGIAEVRAAVDPGSLAELAWAAFERWRDAGYPPKEAWILEALGLLGNDETVRRLAPLIRAWPGEGAHARAVTGLDVFSAIGSDVALMHLHSIAEKAKFKGLKAKAQAKMGEVADGLGLTAEQLADRLVPDFGLDADGTLLLDYGSRRFRVGFDEQLKPIVADEDGARRKVLPKPGGKDDPVLAPAAFAMFAGLKKDVKTVAADQIRRFERAMVTGRRWRAAEQRTLFVQHPLLWHLARRLVWATFDEHDRTTGSFRVAEDRTLADSADEEAAVPDEAPVGIAHPLHLGDSLGAWSDVFADYEILQPFPQLGREVLHLTDAERKSTVLGRFAGMTVPTGRILGLSHRGWERGTPQDAGIQAVTFRAVPGGAVVIDLDPGIYAGEAMELPEQTITGVWLTRGRPDWGNPKGDLRFGLLDPLSASEALRDIEGLRS